MLNSKRKLNLIYQGENPIETNNIIKKIIDLKYLESSDTYSVYFSKLETLSTLCLEYYSFIETKSEVRSALFSTIIYILENILNGYDKLNVTDNNKNTENVNILVHFSKLWQIVYKELRMICVPYKEHLSLLWAIQSRLSMCIFVASHQNNAQYKPIDVFKGLLNIGIILDSTTDVNTYGVGQTIESLEVLSTRIKELTITSELLVYMSVLFRRMCKLTVYSSTDPKEISIYPANLETCVKNPVNSTTDTAKKNVDLYTKTNKICISDQAYSAELDGNTKVAYCNMEFYLLMEKIYYWTYGEVLDWLELNKIMCQSNNIGAINTIKNDQDNLISITFGEVINLKTNTLDTDMLFQFSFIELQNKQIFNTHTSNDLLNSLDILEQDKSYFKEPDIFCRFSMCIYNILKSKHKNVINTRFKDFIYFDAFDQHHTDMLLQPINEDDTNTIADFKKNGIYSNKINIAVVSSEFGKNNYGESNLYNIAFKNKSSDLIWKDSICSMDPYLYNINIGPKFEKITKYTDIEFGNLSSLDFIYTCIPLNLDGSFDLVYFIRHGVRNTSVSGTLRNETLEYTFLKLCRRSSDNIAIQHTLQKWDEQFKTNFCSQKSRNDMSVYCDSNIQNIIKSIRTENKNKHTILSTQDIRMNSRKIIDRFETNIISVESTKKTLNKPNNKTSKKPEEVDMEVNTPIKISKNILFRGGNYKLCIKARRSMLYSIFSIYNFTVVDTFSISNCIIPYKLLSRRQYLFPNLLFDTKKIEANIYSVFSNHTRHMLRQAPIIVPFIGEYIILIESYCLNFMGFSSCCKILVDLITSNIQLIKLSKIKIECTSVGQFIKTIERQKNNPVCPTINIISLRVRSSTLCCAIWFIITAFEISVRTTLEKYALQTKDYMSQNTHHLQFTNFIENVTVEFRSHVLKMEHYEWTLMCSENIFYQLAIVFKYNINNRTKIPFPTKLAEEITILKYLWIGILLTVLKKCRSFDANTNFNSNIQRIHVTTAINTDRILNNNIGVGLVNFGTKK